MLNERFLLILFDVLIMSELGGPPCTKIVQYKNNDVKKKKPTNFRLDFRHHNIKKTINLSLLSIYLSYYLLILCQMLSICCKTVKSYCLIFDCFTLLLLLFFNTIVTKPYLIEKKTNKTNM